MNADEIAKEFSPQNLASVQMKAGREYFRRLNNLILNNQPFVFESTLSGKTTTRILGDLTTRGYEIKIVYLYLRTPELCIARISERVQKGGHPVPDEDVVRRYWRSKRNFWNLYRRNVVGWSIYHNSNDGFEEVAFGAGDEVEIINDGAFEWFMKGIDHE